MYIELEKAGRRIFIPSVVLCVDVVVVVVVVLVKHTERERETIMSDRVNVQNHS